MSTTFVAYEPLEAFLGGNAGTQAEHLGVTARTIHRWKQQGIRRRVAEQLAERFSLHPYELWTELLDIDLAEAEQTEAERRERKNAYRRAHYRRNRDRELAERRRYYAENRDRILAKTSARYWEQKRRSA